MKYDGKRMNIATGKVRENTKCFKTESLKMDYVVEHQQKYWKPIPYLVLFVD